jgi:hypothetical protein
VIDDLLAGATAPPPALTIKLADRRLVDILE